MIVEKNRGRQVIEPGGKLQHDEHEDQFKPGSETIQQHVTMRFSCGPESRLENVAKKRVFQSGKRKPYQQHSCYLRLSCGWQLKKSFPVKEKKEMRGKNEQDSPDENTNTQHGTLKKTLFLRCWHHLCLLPSDISLAATLPEPKIGYWQPRRQRIQYQPARP